MSKRQNRKTNKTESKGMPRKPLKGRTILVTQAMEQSKRFTLLLKQKGATVLECPTIEIAPHEPTHLTKTLETLDQFDWIVFMSQNGVYYFFEYLKKHKIPKTKLKGRRIAAMGKTTRELLKQNKLRVHLVPSVYQSEYLVPAFKGKIEDKHFLIVSAVDGRTIVSDGLVKKGGHVTLLPVYQTLMPINNAKLLKKYLFEERIDAITFTSPSTVNNFIQMLNPDRDIRRHLETMTIATLGDVTAKAVEDNGLRVRVRPSEFTIPAFVNTLSREL